MLLAIIISLFVDKHRNNLSPNTDIKGAGDVNINAQVTIDTQIFIDPEKRIPPTGNDSVDLQIEFRTPDSSVSIFSTNATADLNGVVVMPPLALSPGQYDIAIKGISHLRNLYQDITLSPTIDLSYEVLPAGDSHPTSDNFVNSIDVSYEVINLYEGNVRADLNRDGMVNSLDLATQISHLYQYGDE